MFLKDLREKIFCVILKLLAIFSIFLLGFIIIFILKESFGLFKTISPIKFILGRSWNPIASQPRLGMLPMILGTIYVSFIAICIALPIGVGFSLFMSTYLNRKWKRIIKSVIDILAGIPSVVYGFMGLLVIVKFFEIRFSLSSGETVLAGGILLSIMILPYIVSTCDESMEKVYEKYRLSSSALGVSNSYMVREILLPSSRMSILASTILSLSRAMGETMAVMMVVGNSPIMPKLLGKCETIPSLIAMEMGTAGVGSEHYYALFGSGFVLMIMLIIINLVFYFLKKKVES